MILVSIGMRGFENIRMRWGARAGMIRAHTSTAMAQVLNELQERMRYYPPRQNKRYVRTYRLRNNWQWEIHSDDRGVTGRLYNETKYSRWVQDKIRQTRLHEATPWHTIQDTVTARKRTISETFSRALSTRIIGGFEGLDVLRGGE